jgi:excisionase family DNA binding protein
MSSLLTVDQVAEFLNISPRSVRELCRTRVRENQRHPLPVVRINRQVRFLQSDIEQWIEKVKEVSR